MSIEAPPYNYHQIRYSRSCGSYELENEKLLLDVDIVNA